MQTLLALAEKRAAPDASLYTSDHYANIVSDVCFPEEDTRALFEAKLPLRLPYMYYAEHELNRLYMRVTMCDRLHTVLFRRKSFRANYMGAKTFSEIQYVFHCAFYVIRREGIFIRYSVNFITNIVKAGSHKSAINLAKLSEYRAKGVDVTYQPEDFGAAIADISDRKRSVETKTSNKKRRNKTTRVVIQTYENGKNNIVGSRYPYDVYRADQKAITMHNSAMTSISLAGIAIQTQNKVSVLRVKAYRDLLEQSKQYTPLCQLNELIARVVAAEARLKTK